MRDKSIAKTIGRRARAVRTHLGLSQAAVADRTGISTEAYGRLERGEMRPRIGTLLHLCTALGVQPNDLLLEGNAKKNATGRDKVMAPAPALSPLLRRLMALLARADAATVKRVYTVACWLFEHQASKNKSRVQPSRSPRFARLRR